MLWKASGCPEALKLNMMSENYRKDVAEAPAFRGVLLVSEVFRPQDQWRIIETAIQMRVLHSEALD